MSQHRIPPASYKRFQSLPSKEAKDDFFRSYQEWLNHPFTKDFIHHLNDMLEREVLENENKSDFWSRFHFNFTEAFSKGKRLTIRKLIKDIKDK